MALVTLFSERLYALLSECVAEFAVSDLEAFLTDAIKKERKRRRQSKAAKELPDLDDRLKNARKSRWPSKEPPVPSTT